MVEKILTTCQENGKGSDEKVENRREILGILSQGKEKKDYVDIYELGTIELSDSVYVSDPCYKVGTRCQKFVEGLKPGKYFAFISKMDTRWLRRVSNLWIVHEDYKDCYPNSLVRKAHIGVDSGGAGIYDKEYFEKYHTFEEGKYIGDYPECKEWYDKQWELRYEYDIDGNLVETYYDRETQLSVPKKERREGATMDNKCVISDSGYGDGGYRLFQAKNSEGKIIGLRIEFLDEEWERKYLSKHGHRKVWHVGDGPINGGAGL